MGSSVSGGRVRVKGMREEESVAEMSGPEKRFNHR
jgi:hypothetical protein